LRDGTQGKGQSENLLYISLELKKYNILKSMKINFPKQVSRILDHQISNVWRIFFHLYFVEYFRFLGNAWNRKVQFVKLLSLTMYLSQVWIKINFRFLLKILCYDGN